MKRPFAFVIEDQMNLSILYEDALRLVGYDVLLIRNGLEAVNQIEMKDPPNMIVLDVNLPGLSGRDVLQHIRKNRNYDHVIVVMATANSVMANAIRPELTENDHLFIKPVSMMDLQKIAKDIANKLRKTTTESMSAIDTARITQTTPAIKEKTEDKNHTTEDKQAQTPTDIHTTPTPPLSAKPDAESSEKQADSSQQAPSQAESKS